MYNPFIPIINSSLPEPQASLLTGMIFGVKSTLPKYLYQDMITTGVVHITAISGSNISILMRLISEITITFGRRISSLLTIIFIFCFVFFLGFEPTIIRAAIMGSMQLIAVYFGRQNWALLSLILAAGTMLIINPAWIGNLSFQLSFLATLGMILFGTIKKTQINSWHQELKREVIINLRTTLSAQIFTVPLIFYYFRQISLISPITNLLISWTIGSIMILGIFLSLLGWVWLAAQILLL